MSTTFGTNSMQYTDEQVRLFARGRAWLKGEVGLVKGFAFTGVELTNPHGGPQGPHGSVVDNTDDGIQLRRHAIQVVALEDVAQNAQGQFQVRGLVRAQVKFAANGTFKDGTALLLSTTDSELEFQATASGITNEKIGAKLAAEVAVTDFATPQECWVALEGRSGY